MKHPLIIKALVAFSLSLMVGIVDANALGSSGVNQRIIGSPSLGLNFHQISAIKNIKGQSIIGLQLNNHSHFNGAASAAPLNGMDFFGLSANQMHSHHHPGVIPPLANKQTVATPKQSNGSVYFTQVMNNNAYGDQKASFLNGTVSP